MFVSWSCVSILRKSLKNSSLKKDKGLVVQQRFRMLVYIFHNLITKNQKKPRLNVAIKMNEKQLTKENEFIFS